MSRKTDNLYTGFRNGRSGRSRSRGIARVAFEWTAVTLAVSAGTIIVLALVT